MNRIFWFSSLVVALLTVGSGHALVASAATPPTVPDSLAGVEIVDSNKVMNLMESGGVIVDVRKPEDFKGGTIPGAINCQVSSGDPELGDAQVEATVKTLSACDGLTKADKSKETVAFCNGETCWRSPKAALAMKKMGFAKVLWYRMGGNDWKAKGLPME